MHQLFWKTGPDFYLFSQLILTIPLQNYRHLQFIKEFKVWLVSRGPSVGFAPVTFLIEVTKRGHAEGLLRSTMLADIPIKVVPHRSLNTSKGIICSFDLRDCSEAEIKEHLVDQGVTDVRRMTDMRDGQRRNANTLVLTFGQPVHPTSVKCAYLNIRVETFILNPLHCY